MAKHNREETNQAVISVLQNLIRELEADRITIVEIDSLAETRRIDNYAKGIVEHEPGTGRALVIRYRMGKVAPGPIPLVLNRNWKLEIADVQKAW